MFSKEDFQIESMEDLIEFLPVVPFLGLCAPFLLLGYSIGLVMDIMGLYDQPQ